MILRLLIFQIKIQDFVHFLITLIREQNVLFCKTLENTSYSVKFFTIYYKFSKGTGVGPLVIRNVIL